MKVDKIEEDGNSEQETDRTSQSESDKNPDTGDKGDKQEGNVGEANDTAMEPEKASIEGSSDNSKDKVGVPNASSLNDDSNGSSNMGAMIGAAVGIAVLLIVLVVASVCIIRSRRRNAKRLANQNDSKQLNGTVSPGMVSLKASTGRSIFSRGPSTMPSDLTPSTSNTSSELPAAAIPSQVRLCAHDLYHILILSPFPY